MIEPDLLVLDEATASIDSASEACLQRALEVALRGRTALVVAHRLSTVRDAEQILVLDRGRITERGTHDELVALGGSYAAMTRRAAEADRPRLLLGQALGQRACGRLQEGDDGVDLLVLQLLVELVVGHVDHASRSVPIDPSW